ncbi:MAG: epimerase [Rhodobacteraceae bacterium]|nr:epimerase [Alphaproteobacteria bacterium]NNK66047.1 epimerase [Paracoccaceae bacterium]
MSGTVLILGANGRFGSHAAEAFWNAGWRVRIFDRSVDDLMVSAQGVDLIVNAWNPPYPHWQAQVPGITKSVIAAARAHGCTVLIPGNVYVFGPDAPAIFATDTPHRASNPLGRIRTEMEAAYRASGVPTIILRAGDFLDTQPSGNWFDKVMTARLSKGIFTYPGHTDAPHAWAYLPDLARAAVALANQRADLAPFCDVPFPGYTLTGEELHAALSDRLHRDVTLKRMNWLPLVLARPFWPMARHLLEMRYLWSKPHHLDPARFDALVPHFHTTPIEDALASAIKHQIHPDKPVPRHTGALVSQ